MHKNFFLLFALVSISFFANAGYQPIPVSGYNADVIANGSGTIGTSTTADVDGAGYFFLNQSFTAFGTPTRYLPNDGLISSAATSGITYQLADASSFNSLRLPLVNSSGMLSFVTATSAGTVYVLATTGSASNPAPMVNITVTFTDNTTQVFSNQTVSDWYGGSNFAIQGIGRTSTTALDAGGGATNPIYIA